VIDEEIFLRSVPPRMVVGRAYKLVVVVKNTGAEPTNFLLDVAYPHRYSSLTFYSQEVWKPNNVTLEPGASQRFEYTITPLAQRLEDIEIEARVLSLSHPWQFSSVSARVYEIRTAFPKHFLLGLFGLALLAAFLSLAIIFWRKPYLRLDLTIAILLFTMAFLLRIVTSRNLSLHNDESVFWSISQNFLINDWKWSKHYMLIPYPPVFFYMLAGATYFFEFNLMAIRNISVISGSLSIVVLYFLAKSLYNRKVGFFSALLLCFSSYHIYYSGTAVTDALVILLMLLSSYFFWTGWRNNVLKYYALSGLFFGLAFDIKYIIIVMAPAVVLFILWTRRSLRTLLGKGFLLWALSFLVAISPVQVPLLLNNANPILLYLKLTFGQASVPGQKFYPIQDMIPRGLRMFVYSMARSASPWLPWLSIFEIAICVSLIITAIYYAHATLKGKPRESYLFILMAAVISLLLDPTKHNKWLLYSFPFFFTMLSNITDLYVREIFNKTRKLENIHVNIPKIITLFFILICGFSSVFVGISAPFIDEGEYAAIHSSVLFVRNRVQPDDVIAGFEIRPLYYYLDLYEFDTACISLRTLDEPLIHELEEQVWARIRLDSQLLFEVRPKFIIENRAYFNHYYNDTIKRWVFENYELVHSSRPPLGYNWIGTEFYESLVFERKS
jgi:4-amino-4-deoxy-L-arabinose transferase-like glycosyltransferase